MLYRPMQEGTSRFNSRTVPIETLEVRGLRMALDESRESRIRWKTSAVCSERSGNRAS